MLIEAIKDFFRTKSDKGLVLLPAGGLGSTYLPNSIEVAKDVPTFIQFMETATPYLRFIFIILMLISTVLGIIYQYNKIRKGKY